MPACANQQQIYSIPGPGTIGGQYLYWCLLYMRVSVVQIGFTGSILATGIIQPARYRETSHSMEQTRPDNRADRR